MEGVAWLGLILGVGLFLQIRWSHDRYASVSSVGIWQKPPRSRQDVWKSLLGAVVRTGAWSPP